MLRHLRFPLFQSKKFPSIFPRSLYYLPLPPYPTTNFIGAFEPVLCCAHATLTPRSKKRKSNKRLQTVSGPKAANNVIAAVNRRTRSEKDLNIEHIERHGDGRGHIPVMLGEVLDVFSRSSSFDLLHSFVDCTLGAGGHSSAFFIQIIEAHPELQLYIGLDVDPLAHEKTGSHIDALLCGISGLKAHTHLTNFRNIQTVIFEVSCEHSTSGVNGILMDLGLSSMQVDDVGRGFSLLKNGPLDMRMDPKAGLKAEDILNCWPEEEVGRILTEYGEESNWSHILDKIMKARSKGGLHSTLELVDLVRRATHGRIRGRQGWIKTATRVFQALRIAVNDELRTLDDSLRLCFNCLAPGGRLAVISFHSLEDRIVKKAFLNIIGEGVTDGGKNMESNDNGGDGEAWVKQAIVGRHGEILTKRPITPSEAEERLNKRCRSAKLRVIQKMSEGSHL